MGKKKRASDSVKKWQEIALAYKGDPKLIKPPKACKTKCCKKYKKGPGKRCKKCPCYDLLKRVA